MITLIESRNNNITLTVNVKDDLWRFELESAKITTEDISFDELELFINDENLRESSKNFQNWAGQTADEEDLLYQILNAYLRNDYTDFEFVDGWSVFDKIKNLTKEKNGLAISIPQLDWSGVMNYKLDFATDTDKFYYADDYFMLLDNENAIVTDIEEFYVEAFDEESAAVLKKEKEALYTGENWKIYVDENREYLMEL